MTLSPANSNVLAFTRKSGDSTFTASQSFELDAKGYRVYVKGTFPESEVTGIHTISIKNRTADNRIYNISGQQVKNMKPIRPGIYIQNGKKFIIK